jgi:D-ribose pyranose/furanose isomerase RbsD
MSQAIEKTYGTPLQATILRLLMDNKGNPEVEITTFWIAEQIQQQNPELKEVLTSSEERRRFRKRIENCLKNLVATSQLTYTTKKAVTQTNYNVYHVNF